MPWTGTRSSVRSCAERAPAADLLGKQYYFGEVKGLNVGRPKTAALPVLLLLLCGAFPAGALKVEIGVTGGGGLALMYGSFLDAKADTVAQLGSASPGVMGSSQFQLFPGWVGGLYAEIDVLRWLALRLDIWYESAGAARVGLTSGGAPFDEYGVYFPSVDIPLRARARLGLGPGTLSGSLGPYLGILAGPLTIVDRYSSATTTVVVNPDIPHAFFFGLVGGVGYSLRLGPGTVMIELRADWAILPVTATGQAGGNLNPIGLDLVAGYGIQIGEASR